MKVDSDDDDQMFDKHMQQFQPRMNSNSLDFEQEMPSEQGTKMMEGKEESKKMIKVPDKEQLMDTWVKQFWGACIAQDNWSDRVKTAIDSIRHLTPSKKYYMELEIGGKLR